MKKVITVILMILCGFTVIGGGTLLLTSCGTSTQQSGGGISDSGEIENPSDDENDSDNPDEDVSDGEDDTADDDDKEIEANLQYNVRIYAQIMDANYQTTVLTGTSTNPAQVFKLGFYTLSNGYQVGFYTPSTLVLNTNGWKNGNNVYASYFYYVYDENYGVPCYFRIEGNDASYGFFGASTSRYDFSGTTSFTTLRTYTYLYTTGVSGTCTISYSKPSSSSVGTIYMSGTIYLKFRKSYTSYYNPNGGNGTRTYGSLYYVATSYSLKRQNFTRTGYTQTGWSNNFNDEIYGITSTIPAAETRYGGILELYAEWTPNSYTVSFSGGSGASGSKSSITATYDSWFSVTKTGFSKTGYTFAGWSISGCTSGVTHYYGTGTSSSSYSTTTSTSITHSITGTGYYKNLRSTSGTVTFTARWTINAYTLSIKFMQYATNDTNLDIYQADCRVDTSISSGQSATVSHFYTTSSYNVRLRFSNASSTYVYFLNVGSRVSSTTNYDALMTSSTTSYYYSWRPDSNDTITVYACQRYAISFNGNGYTSGTVPSTVYKVHGYAATIPANSLTRTLYMANGWNTKADGTGTHFTTSYGYSTGNVTLYADWTARTATVKVQIRTSTNGTSYSNSVTGGTVSVQYYRDVNNTVTSTTQSITSASLTALSYSPLISRVITFTGTVNSDYAFVGVSTSTSPPATTSITRTFTPSVENGTYTIYVYFTAVRNQLRYDSDRKYWYLEDGKFPQSYAAVEWQNYGGDKSYNGINITYDENTKVLTLNGTISNASSGDIFSTHGINFLEDQEYLVVREYISGSVTVSGATSFVIDVSTSSNGNPSTRNYNDGAPATQTTTSNLTINSASQNEADGFKFWIWCGETGKLIFNNYKTRVYLCYDRILDNITMTDRGSLSYLDANGQTQTIQYCKASTAVADMPADSEFALVGGRWFKVEPIRWRVSEYGVSSTDYPDGWDAYGSYNTNFTVVSDRVLMASAVTNQTVSEGWAFTSSELFSNVSISNTNSASAYADPEYDTSRSVTYYRYGNAGQQDKVTTVSRTENGSSC